MKTIRNLAFLTILTVLMTMAGCAGETPEPVPTAPVQTETVQSAVRQTQPAETQPTETQPMQTESAQTEVTYDTLLEAYRTALAENWDPEKLAAADMSILCCLENGGDGLRNIGYAITDMSGEGTPDLVIASCSPESDKTIFDLYTMKDGKVIHLCSSWERSRNYFRPLTEDSYHSELISRSSSSAASSQIFTCSFGEGELLVTQGFKYDAEADPDDPWFMGYMMDGEMVWESTTEDFVLPVLELAESQYYMPELTPFGE